jgi:hypothetical protein
MESVEGVRRVPERRHRDGRVQDRRWTGRIRPDPRQRRERAALRCGQAPAKLSLRSRWVHARHLAWHVGSAVPDARHLPRDPLQQLLRGRLARGARTLHRKPVVVGLQPAGALLSSLAVCELRGSGHAQNGRTPAPDDAGGEAGGHARERRGRSQRRLFFDAQGESCMCSHYKKTQKPARR